MTSLLARFSLTTSTGLSSLFRAAPSPSAANIHVRDFKVVSALRRRCRDCRTVKRGKKLYVLCNTEPRHKQRQGKGGSLYKPSH